jgi:hypothetical protein
MSDSITGEVFLDPSADGAVADGGGAGIGPGTATGQAGVTVELIAPASGAILSTTTTAADGTYSFDSLADGDYQVLFVAPTGFAFSPTDGGSDSVANPKTGLSSVFTLSSSGNTTQFNEDAGLMPLAGITGQVFLDSVGTGSLAGATGAGANVLGASVTVKTDLPPSTRHSEPMQGPCRPTTSGFPPRTSREPPMVGPVRASRPPSGLQARCLISLRRFASCLARAS